MAKVNMRLYQLSRTCRILADTVLGSRAFPGFHRIRTALTLQQRKETIGSFMMKHVDMYSDSSLVG